MDLFPLIADGSVDMIFADLPYGTTECSWDFVIPMAPLWEQYKRVLKPNGAVLLTAAQPFTSLLVASNLEWYRCEWIWEKGNATGFLNAKKQPLRAHESILAFYKKQPTYNPQITHGHKRETTKRRAVNSECYGRAFGLAEYDSTSRYPRSVQFFSSDKQKSNLHPTQKPVALMEYMIRTYSNSGDLVLDNTMGSCTTGVACANSGRKFIGFESDVSHFDTACNRLAAPYIPIPLLQAFPEQVELI
ncbi:DNA-methyltransferase [Herminiimonas contaminans]|nr:site-specific DNA-methyltransferase [Herminiimonas contaminans]